MQLEAPGKPLVLRARETPVAGDHGLLIKVAACGVCRTDHHVVDGELYDAKTKGGTGH
jgi:propanol-preferring alcohol dehydrogenase